VLPAWNGINTLSISGMVRYGGTSVAAVDASVSAKPSINCQRYGRAKRPSRSSTQVDGGTGDSRASSASSSALSSSSGALPANRAC
jgi:hypothetical protein